MFFPLTTSQLHISVAKVPSSIAALLLRYSASIPRSCDPITGKVYCIHELQAKF